MKPVPKPQMDATLEKFQKREKLRKQIILKEIGNRPPYTEKEIHETQIRVRRHR